MTPQVSVIMPAFNTGRWIRQAIQSVLDQTLTEVEILVVDDGSTDDTVAVVASIQDERVRLLRQPENRGVSAARNVALDHAQGTWAAILDSDDWLARRDRLAALVALGAAHKADLVADDLYLVEEGKDYAWATMVGRKALRLREPTWVDLPMFVKYDLGPIKPLVRVAFLRERGIRYDETLRITEDCLFYMECLLSGARLILSPEPGYAYRMRPGSLSRGVLPTLGQVETNLRRYLGDERVAPYPEVVALLQKKLAEVRSNRRYYRVMAPLKERNLARALAAAIRTPDFPWLFALRVTNIVDYRVRRRLVKLRLPG